MHKHFRFFLIAEGKDTGYPNYESATIHFSVEDPSSLSLQNSYLCSPLFSTTSEEVGQEIPILSDEMTITFIMMPCIYPLMHELLIEVNPTNEIWFSLGLANLIIIEKSGQNEITEKTIGFLKTRSNITASESWIIKNNKISKHTFPFSEENHKQKDIENLELPISDSLPLHIKFAVSEYKLFASKFLTASKKFTPHYYVKHTKSVIASSNLIKDLSFLFGDFSYTPTNALLSSIGANSLENAKELILTPEIQKRREELINDRNGRLIQFNSSMSYVFSQTYSGTFPLFDHTGIIQRHSLLGVGSAISALTELLTEIEEALFFLPFEQLKKSQYSNNLVTNLDFFNSFQEVSNHTVTTYINDGVRNAIIAATDLSKITCTLPDDFFSRLAFYSGRLGFREYDLSATAAIQVLVEANSLQWNIINYTHEIIHNHVRLILNQIWVPSLSIRSENYEAWLTEYLRKLKNVFASIKTITCPPDITYNDFFTLILIKFCINYPYYGSLTRPCNKNLLLTLQSDVSKSERYKLPNQNELGELIIHLYKDITEIFVHVIDFCYIYTRNTETYLQSIWASWSTVSAVSNDIKQYILRTLVVIALNEPGTVSNRFEKSKANFIRILEKIAGQNGNAYLFSKIKTLLDDPEDIDLKNRFTNCILIGDLVNHFFVGRLETYLDKNDKNIGQVVDDDGNVIYHNIDRDSFEGHEILSKVRFLLGQLVRETIANSSSFTDDKKERTSAWLLLALSTQNRYD